MDEQTEQMVALRTALDVWRYVDTLISTGTSLDGLHTLTKTSITGLEYVIKEYSEENTNEA